MHRCYPDPFLLPLQSFDHQQCKHGVQGDVFHLLHNLGEWLDGRVWPEEDELDVLRLLDLIHHVTGRAPSLKGPEVPGQVSSCQNNLKQCEASGVTSSCASSSGCNIWLWHGSELTRPSFILVLVTPGCRLKAYYCSSENLADVKGEPFQDFLRCGPFNRNGASLHFLRRWHVRWALWHCLPVSSSMLTLAL